MAIKTSHLLKLLFIAFCLLSIMADAKLCGTQDNCAECTTGDKACKTCVDGFYLESGQTGKCTACKNNVATCDANGPLTCKSGQAPINKQCCPAHSLQCDDDNNAVTCENGYYLKSADKTCVQCTGTGVLTCTETKVLTCDATGQTKYVLKADASGCELCSAFDTNCSVCNKDSRTCKTCKTNYDINSLGGCTTSSTSCNNEATVKTCTNDKIALTCNDNYTPKNPAATSCELCTTALTDCESCHTNIRICLACKDGTNKWPVNGVCTLCTSDSAKTCNNEGKPTSCNDGWYQSGLSCVKCGSNALTCDAASAKTCKAGYKAEVGKKDCVKTEGNSDENDDSSNASILGVPLLAIFAIILVILA